MDANINPERQPYIGDDPSERVVPCATCRAPIAVGRCHSIAVVYIGWFEGAWRYTVHDADQPLCCSQACAVGAAQAYHAAHGAEEWTEGDAKVAFRDQRDDFIHPTHTTCHGCGSPRTLRDTIVFFDYRCTDGPTPFACMHVLCDACLPDAAGCVTAHLLPEHAARVTRNTPTQGD